jgi:radical SAM enzyme (TIGR01210 family)
MKKHSTEKIIKIYNSGSFFDENEIARSLQDKILKILFEKAEKVVVETRPEFVDEERLNGISNLEIAIGLESANDFVLNNSINKGFLLKDYKRAAEILNKLGIPLRTYLLIKPPFLFERDAITDAVMSAKTAARHSQIISFNPVNIQKFTLVEKLYLNREYRPPWLWSVVEVLKQSSKLSHVRLISAPTAGGTKKGAHNCGKCDSDILKNIEEFSHTQDRAFLDELQCDCMKDWQDILSTQGLARTHGDLFRLV